MDHDNMPPPSPSSLMMNQTKPQLMMIMHMTFFWGKNTEVLFSGWPGTSSGMYALCLIFVFLLAVIAEWLAHSLILRSGRSSSRAVGVIQTAVYTLKTSLSYLVMLAVMSFNAGVFIFAIAGYAVGFFLFRSSAFKKSSDDTKIGELLPPSAGCVS